MMKMLRDFEHYGVSENIEIAKGKYELQLTVKGAFEQRKREKEWQKRNL